MFHNSPMCMTCLLQQITQRGLTCRNGSYTTPGLLKAARQPVYLETAPFSPPMVLQLRLSVHGSNPRWRPFLTPPYYLLSPSSSSGPMHSLSRITFLTTTWLTCLTSRKTVWCACTALSLAGLSLLAAACSTTKYTIALLPSRIWGAFDYAMPVEEHPELWYPLETVLSSWIELIHIGKITAAPSEAPPLFSGEKMGPWDWQSYSEAQVITCISAWDLLCNAIEARLPSTSGTIELKPELEPLPTPAVLDAAPVPNPCFARSFLTRACRPHFRYIAPGLLLPPVEASEFAAMQPFTRIPREP